MTGWPSLDPSEDERLAEALTAGDLDALAQIFDAYGARLYDYCHALLRDQDVAAAALQDTLLAACVHVGRLGEPDRLRAWLYAMARNECLRRLHATDAEGRPAPPGMVVDPYTGEPRPPVQAPEVLDTFADEQERARRLELRRLVHGALSGLGGRRREALDLLLRHALSPAELAGVLALDDTEADELARDARFRLDEALLVAIIAQSGRCPEVAALMEGRPWPPSPQVAREVGRHLDDGCPVCAEQRERRVAAGRLLQALPVALLPPDLRADVLTSATAPEYDELRVMAAQRAEPFDEWGWPAPVDRPAYRSAERSRERRQGPRLLPALAAAVLVVLVVAAAFLWLPGGGSGSPAASGSSPEAEAPETADVSPTDDEESPSPDDSPTPTVTRPSVTPSSPRATRSASSSPSPSRSRSTPGVLAVSGCSIPADSSSCTITVSAQGGTVRWSVTGRSGVVAVGGGTLAAGRSASVRATRLGRCEESGSGSVSFSPSGTATVSWTCPEPEEPPGEDPGDPPGPVD